jgi:hypothetical protein
VILQTKIDKKNLKKGLKMAQTEELSESMINRNNEKRFGRMNF